MKKIIIIAAIAIFGIASFSFTSSQYFEISKNLEIFTTLYKEVNTFYVDDVEPNEFIQTGIDAMLKSLDPYTTYYPESEIENYRFQTTGKYGGIGSYIKRKADYIIISEPYENSPAEKAGLIAGDKIIAVDDKEIKGKTSDEVSRLLKGQPGTELIVKVKRPQIDGTDKNLEIKITREEVKVKNVPYYGLVEDGVGYIKLQNFTQKAGQEVEDAFKALKKDGATSIVLDLRGNPGGLLTEAVNITNVFVPKNQLICFTKGKVKDWDKDFKTKNEALDTEIPVAVLTSRGSASASEIVSGAIQDLDRGVVIGQKTFGKGLVQTTKSLDYNTTLKVTTAKYYIPSGRCIQAINYAEKDETGAVKKIPDSLKVAFKTANGRQVFDGGGIDPDVVIEEKPLSYLSSNLMRKDFVFDYATIFKLKNESIANAKNFKLSDAQYQDFMEWIADKDYDYQTESEQLLEELETASKEDEYFDAIEATLATLKEELQHDKSKDLISYKNEIKMLLESEIAKRYYNKNGSIENYFNYDKELKEAIAILQDKDKYDTLLK
ncbi:MAG: S41 family peptidase [Chitinophagales bacterium]